MSADVDAELVYYVVANRVSCDDTRVALGNDIPCATANPRCAEEENVRLCNLYVNGLQAEIC